MFDVNLLDRMSFGDLGETLRQVLERMDVIRAEISGDEEDPRLDVLFVIANQIIVRMDSIMQEYGRSHPEVLDQWGPVAKGYKEGFKQYSKTYLKEGVPLIMARPENPSQAPDPDAAWGARLDEIVLDEKLLDGMNAGDLFRLNALITDEVKRLDEELPEEVAEPVIEKLLKFGDIVIRRLDPLVREAYRNKPEPLARWEAIMNDYKDLDDEGGENARADIESSEVS